MSNEFSHERPELKLEDKFQRQEIWREGLLFVGNISEHEIEKAYKMVEVAQRVGPRICRLPGNDGNSGFMIGITKNVPNFPILTVQIGEVDKIDPEYGTDGKRAKYAEFVKLKAQVLQNNTSYICSNQNLGAQKPEQIASSKGIAIPGGAIVFNNDWIISTSAFKNASMDTATSLAIATGVGLVGIDYAEDLAHNEKLDCKSEFMQMVDIVVEEVLH